MVLQFNSLWFRVLEESGMEREYALFVVLSNQLNVWKICLCRLKVHKRCMDLCILWKM